MKGQPGGRPRRGLVWRLLPFGLLAVILLEFWVIIQVGSAIGVGWTLLALVADTVLGVWLVQLEGRRTLVQLVATSARGRIPSREIADGALVLLGGLLIMLPGFVLDVVGLVLVLPFTRPLARGAVQRAVAARTFAGMPFAGAAGAAGDDPTDTTRPRPPGTGPVVEGEVVEDDED